MLAPRRATSTSEAPCDAPLRALSGEAEDDVQLALLCLVIGIDPGGEGAAISKLTPEQLQQATFEAVSTLVGRLISYGPTVLVLEDLHWSDPTSLSLTARLGQLANDGALLLVLTRRPEPDPGVSALLAVLEAEEGRQLQDLELAPFDRDQERVLVHALLGEDATKPVLNVVTRGSDGNPLFLEERVASLLETRAIVRTEANGWQVDAAVKADIPEAVERLVRSRIDRLEADAHEAIVAASVLGRGVHTRRAGRRRPR